MDGIQLGMPINATIIPEVSPEDGTRISCQIPFLFLLQELKPGRASLLYGGCTNAAGPFWNATIGLDLDGIRTVIWGELISVLNCTIRIAEGVGINGRAP